MKIKSITSRILLLGLAAQLLSPGLVSAANPITARKATVSNSAGGATAIYTVGLTLGTSGQTLGAIKFELCDSPILTTACAGTGDSSGASFGSATFGSVTGLGGSWSANAGTAGGAGGSSIVFKKAAPGVEAGTPAATVVINGVVNPTTSNKQYYLRISTYSDVAASSPVYPGTDYGAVALSTSQQITVSGTMPESLVFCVGTSGTTCGNITGSAIDLGTFSPSATSTGSSVMSASTNAGSGYIVTVNGGTLTSGANSISALASQTASTLGTAQFGLNVSASGVGSGTVNGNYSNGTLYRFNSTDIVASAAGPTNANLFTSSYIVNVPGSQAAGLYTATMTYICTATF